MSYENHKLHTLHDGTIFLYTRDGSSIFHARIKIHGVSGYVKIASTRKRTLTEAYEVAKGWYEAAKHKSRHNHRIKERWTPQERFGRVLSKR